MEGSSLHGGYPQQARGYRANRHRAGLLPREDLHSRLESCPVGGSLFILRGRYSAPAGASRMQPLNPHEPCNQAFEHAHRRAKTGRRWQKVGAASQKAGYPPPQALLIRATRTAPFHTSRA